MRGLTWTHSIAIVKTRKPLRRMASGMTNNVSAARRHGDLSSRSPAIRLVMNNTSEERMPLHSCATWMAAIPKMRRISRWTTYFPISEKNGFGANIWIPARLIDGYVVAPGATFDFWDAVGSVTRAKGYRSGGAIINGRTEPQGALAGGICSCSTTLFNAALRAGYEMGARRNHYYYIDRYPLGLDATVFISASGSKQTMSFTSTADSAPATAMTTKSSFDGLVSSAAMRCVTTA